MCAIVQPAHETAHKPDLQQCRDIPRPGHPRPDNRPPSSDCGCLGLTDSLLTRILDILKAHPRGIGEYELLRELERQCRTPFNRAPFRDHLALFHAHFLLFNALYRLRDRLAAAAGGWLEIDVLCIRLQPAAPARSAQSQALARHDPLRAYYLDIHQLANTKAEQVADWLGDFWMRYFALESRAAALAVFGLNDPVNAREIRRRYRELAMRLHPDRGGDAEAFRRLSAAKQVLERSDGYRQTT